MNLQWLADSLREGECRSYRYTLIDTTAVTESNPSFSTAIVMTAQTQ
jgi:hypothetical protein